MNCVFRVRSRPAPCKPAHPLQKKKCIVEKTIMPDPFKITFCGDTSLGYFYLKQSKNRYPAAYKRLQDDPFSFFEGVLPLLEGSDEIIINLETVLTTDPGAPLEGKQWSGFDDPDVTIEMLKRLKVTAVTLANNHTMDYGEQKMIDMLDRLRANGIATIGAGRTLAEARKPYVISLPGSGRKVHVINGMRTTKRYIDYGFFAGKEKAGINSTNLPAIKRQIERIKNNNPEAVVVLCPHWQGIDYRDVDDIKKQWSRDAIDAGADLVVAHGSHKKDEVEEYAGKMIYHSIGNFVFNSPGRYEKMQAEPLSMVVALFPETLKCVSTNTHTDNKANGFRTEASGNFSIQAVADNVVADGKYIIRGTPTTYFSGTTIVTHSYSDAPDAFFVVGDLSWPESEMTDSEQMSWGPEKTIKRAIAEGFQNFVIPSYLSHFVNNKTDIKNAIFVDDTWQFFRRSAAYISNRELSP